MQHRIAGPAVSDCHPGCCGPVGSEQERGRHQSRKGNGSGNEDRHRPKPRTLYTFPNSPDLAKTVTLSFIAAYPKIVVGQTVNPKPVYLPPEAR